jgi:TonB family protein
VSYTILYVDRDGDRAENLRGPLENAGFRWLCAESGDGALEILTDERPDMMVVDAEGEGAVPDFCRRVRAAEPADRSVLLIVSGDDGASDEAVSELAHAGCDLLVEKPLTADRLLALCHELLDTGAADDGETLEIGKKTSDRPAGHDGLLDSNAVESAMGRLESMVDAHDPEGDRESTGAAAARGDFSGLLDEVNVDHPPTHPVGESSESERVAAAEAVEGAATDAVAAEADAAGIAEIAEIAEIEVETVEPVGENVAAGGATVEARRGSDDGRDIEDHLDSLFSGAAPVTRAPRPDAAPPATPSRASAVEMPEVPVPVAAPAPSEAPADAPVPEPSDPMDEEVEHAFQEEDLPSEPGADDTAPFTPPRRAPDAHELFDPREIEPAVSRLDQRKGGQTWMMAVAAGVIVLIAAGAWYFTGSQGSEDGAASDAEPVAAVETPVAEPRSNLLASAGLSTDSVGETTDEPASLDSEASPAAAAPASGDSETPTEAAPTNGSGAESASTKAKTADATPRSTSPAPEKATRAAISEPAPVKTPETAPAPRETAPSERSSAETESSGNRTASREPAPAVATKDEPDARATAAASPAAAEPQATTAPSTPPMQNARSADTAQTTPEPVVPAESSAPAPADEPASPATATTSERAAASEPIQPVEDVRVPVVLSRVEPELSKKALKKGGTVVLKVLVNEDGGISRVLVERGIPGSDAEAAAISAVLRWSFQPATRQGEPIRAWTKVTFDF